MAKKKGVCMAFPESSESGVVQAAMSSLTANTANAGSILQQRFTQTNSDSAAMWAIAMTTPTVNAAMGQRIATESGSGATRRDVNYPVGYAPGGGT